MSHRFACLWALQTTFYEGPRLLDTWLGAKGYCVGPYDISYVNNATGVFECNDAGVCVDCKTHPYIYFASLYLSIMTVTSIGNAVPLERPKATCVTDA